MSRYIDAEKLINRINAYVINSQDVMFIRKLIKDLETEDVAPVVHAHWVHRTAEWNFTEECSKCHFGHDYRTPFCPICGAKMDEKEGKE